ncbi:hypothetical protein [Mangrovicoccus sp. HB161399]|uniref:hypothetical protein n=1 Tax=Mangrovicoccus sp. HB161399 TaxID=2720392 RepID=UPI001554268F|nr:hypothetical protein [Mangrovicoccus sp. HB161399]
METGIGRTVALDAGGMKVADCGGQGMKVAAGNLVLGGGGELVFETETGIATHDGATGALLAAAGARSPGSAAATRGSSTSWSSPPERAMPRPTSRPARRSIWGSGTSP